MAKESTGETQALANDRAGVLMEARSVYRGPIPPATELKKYEAILPGSADRILKMAEKQAAHRQDMENKMLEANIREAKNGQVFGFLIFFCSLTAGFILIAIGKDGAGLLTSLVSLGTIISLFVYDRISKKNELQNKNE